MTVSTVNIHTNDRDGTLPSVFISIGSLYPSLLFEELSTEPT